MRRKLKRITRAAVAALVVAAGLAVSPAPAQAANWDQSIQGVVQADRLLAHPDGKVTVASCGGPSGDTLQAKTYDTAGSTSYVNEVANGTSPKLYACTGQSAIGKDGSLYASGYYSGQSYERLVAYKNNAQKWNVQLPNGCSSPGSIAMGVNGNVYVVATGCSSGGSTNRLIGYTPEVATGTTAPSVVMNVAVHWSFPGAGDNLAAFDDGLVVHLASTLQFFDYSGSTPGEVEITRMARGYDGAIVTNMNGRTFYPIGATSTEKSLCSTTDNNLRVRIEGQSPSGVDWTYPLTHCERVWYLRPTYDGGVVASVWRHDSTTGDPTGHWLVAIDGYGNEKWSQQVNGPTFDDAFYLHSITTTLNGDVLLATVLDDRNNNPVNDRRVAFNLYSGATGQNIGHAALGGTTHGYSFASINDYVAVADGRVYAALSQCNYTSCSSNKALHSFDMAAMTAAYPLGAVLASDEPWLDYVALGDSFSSGEGVEPFQAGTAITDVNTCHRSAHAYSRQLNGNPSKRLYLTAFVACSGATTADVINGKWGEDPQLDALSSSTDVVTISIGGNDIEFVEFATECVGWPEFNPINVCDTSNPQYDRTMDLLDNELPDRLTSTTVGNLGVLRRVRQEAPNATIYVLGYPQLAPSTDDVHQWPYCSWLNSQSEHVAAREIVSRLNLRLSEAVEEMDSDFVFIDPNETGSPFINHELCDSSSYFNGPQLPKEYSLHPNLKGQSAYTQLIASRL